jgi:hypothetical protein
VASLADEVAMSTSAFARPFTSLVGEPPMKYVAHWHNAASDGSATLGPSRLGHGSEAGFGPAFKRIIGEWPGSMKGSGSDHSH